MCQHGGKRADEGGFTLVELLVAIVVVGVLTAVAVVGMGGLVDKGADAACAKSKDAAISATIVYYSNTGGRYPQTFTELTHPAVGSPLLDTSAGMTETASTLRGKDGWVLTLNPGATPTDQTTITGSC